MVHLVYCDNTGKRGERVPDKILCGTKTMVVRGATGRKIPHSRVHVGETLYFMEKGSLAVSAKATVKDVKNHVKLTEDEINAAFSENAAKLNLTDKQRERCTRSASALSSSQTLNQSFPRYRLKSRPIWTTG